MLRVRLEFETIFPPAICLLVSIDFATSDCVDRINPCYFLIGRSGLPMQATFP